MTGRGAEGLAPRPTPLTLVRGAVAGDDLHRVAAAAGRAIGSPVAIAIPALGEPVVSPSDSLSADEISAVQAMALTAINGRGADTGDVVAVRIGDQTLGVVAVTKAASGPNGQSDPERQAWLEATAAAASVTAVLAGDRQPELDETARALLEEVLAGIPEDLPTFLIRARRLGVELGAGAVALCAAGLGDSEPRRPGALLAKLGDGRARGLIPIGSERLDGTAERLRASGATVALSSPRRDPALLHEALREAELLVELALVPDAQLAGQDATYRLLIGVLLREPGELMMLRERTIAALAAYDARHDTDLLQTLQAFLDHDGSTSETADALELHRHTVGYRLSRVHEVSGLSPYESDGRERLSLGLKAHQILDAERRLRRPQPPAAPAQPPRELGN
ncbi:MAG TPA: helix-turn-helix domain-containing protein [Solirubrobacteraceae bacterium]